jgi:hypothetical protein
MPRYHHTDNTEWPALTTSEPGQFTVVRKPARTQTCIREIWGSLGGQYEDCCLQISDAVVVVETYPSFRSTWIWRTQVPPKRQYHFHPHGAHYLASLSFKKKVYLINRHTSVREVHCVKYRILTGFMKMQVAVNKPVTVHFCTNELWLNCFSGWYHI